MIDTGIPKPLSRAARALLVAALAALAAGPAQAQAGLDSTAAPPAAEAPAATGTAAPAEVPAPVVAESPGTRSNPRFTAVRKVKLTGARNVVRSGPGPDYSIAGVFEKDRAFVVIAKRGEWYDVRLSETESGWVHSSLCKEFDDLSDLEYKPNPRLFNRTGSFTFTGYTGAYAFDRKSNSLVLGGRLGYYVLDRIVAEGGASWTRIQRNPEIVESLFGLTLEAEDFHMLFYHLMVTWELLPGRQMVPFVSGGVGNSIMRGETEPSINFGAGTTLFISRRTAVKWEVRDYRMQTGAGNARVTNHNIEFSLGTAYLF